MKVGKQSFNTESLKDLKKKEFVKKVNERACGKSADEVWKMFVEAKKKSV